MWFCQVFVVDSMLIIRPVLSVKEKIKKYIVELRPDKVESLSEEA